MNNNELKISDRPGSGVFAGSFRVRYIVDGTERGINVQTEFEAEARRMVTSFFPAAVVTGVHQIKL